MHASVVIATHNRAHLLEATLRALDAQAVPSALRWEVIVVDNASRDATAEVVDAVSATAAVPIRCVHEPQLGLSRARNRGIGSAQGSVIAFTDDDVLPAADWIAQLVGAFGRWNADGVGGRILPRWEGSPPPWLAGSAHLRSRLSIMDFEGSQLLTLPLQRQPQVWGANMAFRRELFDRVGQFDLRLGAVGGRLHRGEESDLITRALEGGMRIAYDAAATVHHRIGPDRMRRAYFRRLAFDDGEGAAWPPEPTNGRSLFGAPLWRYRAACVEAWRLLPGALLHRPGAFERELAWLWSVGRISGCWKARRERSR